MAKQHYVIMILGLGKHVSKDTDPLPGYWHRLGISGEIYRMNWSGEESYETRFNKLLGRIDKAANAGKTVSLIGVSAGASAAVNAYVKRKKSIHKVVFVCGRLGGIELINPSYYKKYPVFMESIQKLPESINNLDKDDKQKMLSMYGLYDDLVPASTARINGVRNKRMLSGGHVLNCIIGLTFYSRSIAKFIKN